MMRRARTALLLPCLLLSAAPAMADESTPASASASTAAAETEVTIRAFTENDGTFYNPASSYDRHFTGSAGMSAWGRPQWLEPVSEELPFWDIAGSQASATRTGGGLLFVGALYTPQDITVTAPIANDQPFAGYFYGGGVWQRETDLADQPHVRVLEHVELDLGVLGPSAHGEDIQHYLHTNVGGRPNPGWRNQLRDEPIVQAVLRRKWVLDQDFFGAPHHQDYQWELIPDATLVAGTLRDFVNTGAEARFGVNLPHDFGTPRLDDQGTPGCDWSGPGRRGSSFYVFARASATLVAHDTLVDGSLFHDAPTAAGSRIHGEPLRGDLSAGFRWCWFVGRTQMEFGYALTVLSPTFREQKGCDSYGSFRFASTFHF